MGASVRPFVGVGRGLRNGVSGFRIGFGSMVTRVATLTRRRSLSTPALCVVAAPVEAPQKRPEPQLKWNDPEHAPDGDFAACAIVNAELDITAVPQRGESWDAVSDFALSYDGYAYWDDLATLAGSVLQRWTRRRSLPDTLDELRGCLFYEQRRWHHFGEEPSGRSAEYMWAMVNAIGALASPVKPTFDRVAPTPARVAAKSHVKLVATRAVALRPVPAPALTLRPLPASGGRLVAVPAAEAHVRLVSSIEGDADAVSRHPAGHASKRPWGQLSGPAGHRASSGSTRDLRPMPSADPLPKPPVIVRRTRRAGTTGPNRPRATVPTTHGPTGAWPANGARRKFDPANAGPLADDTDLDDDTDPAADTAGSSPPPSDATATTGTTTATVTAMCRQFHDEATYVVWAGAHPHGLVLNQTRSGRTKAPTLHRVGCAALAPREGSEALPAGVLRVCGPSGDALEAWSVAQGLGVPTACRRCRP
jgi:hypothetical protein